MTLQLAAFGVRSGPRGRHQDPARATASQKPSARGWKRALHHGVVTAAALGEHAAGDLLAHQKLAVARYWSP